VDHQPETARFIHKMPGLRSERTDDHHLLFSRAAIDRLGLVGARDLPCAIWRGDSLVHSLVHQMLHQDGIGRLGDCDAYAFGLDARAAIQRHDEQWCACTQPNRKIWINALTYEPLRDDEPPCLGQHIDYKLVELLQRWYRPVAYHSTALLQRLEQRCRTGECTCPRLHGDNLLRPAGWNFDLPQAA
jgi:hypothetical protein